MYSLLFSMPWSAPAARAARRRRCVTTRAIITTLGGEPLHWLGSDLALYSVVVVNVWGAIGEGMIIFLAGLQSIPQDIYEASDLAQRNRIAQMNATVDELKNGLTIMHTKLDDLKNRRSQLVASAGSISSTALYRTSGS